MTLTNKECEIIDFCFKVSDQKNQEGLFTARYFETKDQVVVLDIYRKINPVLEGKEKDIELCTEEKALILAMVDRPLPVEMLEDADSLRGKLK